MGKTLSTSFPNLAGGPSVEREGKKMEIKGVPPHNRHHDPSPPPLHLGAVLNCEWLAGDNGQDRRTAALPSNIGLSLS